jgi:hypothetical protein
MSDPCEAAQVLPVTSLTEYFRDSLHTALQKQQLAVDGHTQHYVVNVLTLFARSEALFEQTPDGLRLKPLVAMLSEALEAPNLAERQRGLQRLGDVSLFIAGFFARSFARKLVDIDSHQHGRTGVLHARRHRSQPAGRGAGAGVRRTGREVPAAGGCVE